MKAQAAVMFLVVALAFLAWVIMVSAEPLKPDGYALDDCGGAIDGKTGLPLVCCRVVKEEKT